MDSCRFERLELNTQLSQVVLLAQRSRDRVQKGNSLEERGAFREAKQVFSGSKDEFPCEQAFAKGLIRIQQRQDQYVVLKQQADADLGACRFKDARSHYEDAGAQHAQFAERDKLRFQIDLINALEGLRIDLAEAEEAFQKKDYQRASTQSAKVLNWKTDRTDLPQCHREIAGRATVVRATSKSRLLYLEATQLLGTERYAEAEKALKEVLKLDPEHVEARRSLETTEDFGRRYSVAMDRCQKGQYETCRQMLLEAKELDPDRFLRVGGQGMLRECGQKKDQARAVELLLDYGQIDSSITLLERLARDSDPDPSALLGVAYAYKGFLESGEARDKKIAKAKEQFRRALALRKTYTLRWDLPPHILKIFREAGSEAKNH